MTTRDLAVVVVAAGRGERLGSKIPKAFVQLFDRTILEHSLAALQNLDALAQVIVAAPASHIDQANDIVELALENAGVDFSVVEGGSTRQQSIANALAELGESIEVVLIHDAARPFASQQLFERVATAVRETLGSVIPALEVADTIKRIEGNQVLETIERESLRAAQTPQGFVAGQLISAYAKAGTDFTDDAALMQSLGHKVTFVPGEVSAHKITTGVDLSRAISTLMTGSRVGVGVDVHRFSGDATKKLFLGTIEWPGERGLDGHSDGDAVAHAVVDALLSAAALGDIGSNFGVDRPEFAGANGSVFISETIEMLAEIGLKPVNVSVELIGNRPKVAPHREAVEKALSELVGASVTFGATTTDGLGFLGNDEGVAAVAYAMVVDVEGRLTT